MGFLFLLLLAILAFFAMIVIGIWNILTLKEVGEQLDLFYEQIGKKEV